MNVQFSRSLSGFNREEVIEYIRKLTAEKTRAERETFEIAEKLESAENQIDKMASELREGDERIYNLETEINEKDALIEQLRKEISNLTEKLNSVNDEKNRVLAPALLKAGAAEAELRTMAAELTELSDRVKKAHADISDAVVTIEDYARE